MIDPDPRLLAARWSGGAGHQLRTTTDSSGRFSLGGIFADTVHFAVDAPGYSPLIQRDFRLPAEDAELALTLQRGCTLLIEVREVDGRPLRHLDLWASVADYPRYLGKETQPGAYEVADLPLNTVATIHFDWGGRHWTRDLRLQGDATERITLPATGKLVIDYAAIGPPPFEIRLMPIEGTPAVSQIIHTGPSGSTPVYEVSPVAVGEYTLTLFTASLETADCVARSIPLRLTIRGGETTRLVLQAK